MFRSLVLALFVLSLMFVSAVFFPVSAVEQGEPCFSPNAWEEILEISPDEQHFLVSSLSGVLECNLHDSSLERQLPKRPEASYLVSGAYSPSGNRIATGDNKGGVLVWEGNTLVTGTVLVLETNFAHLSKISYVKWPDEHTILAGISRVNNGQGSNVFPPMLAKLRLTDAQQLELLWIVELYGNVQDLEVNVFHDLIAIASGDQVELLNLTSGEHEQIGLEASYSQGEVDSIALTDSVLAVNLGAGRIALWHVGTLRPLGVGTIFGSVENLTLKGETIVALSTNGDIFTASLLDLFGQNFDLYIWKIYPENRVFKKVYKPAFLRGNETRWKVLKVEGATIAIYSYNYFFPASPDQDMWDGIRDYRSQYQVSISALK